MRLTRKKSIELCILLWTWLAETGKKKYDWPEWVNYGEIKNECWFCEYCKYRDNASKGPYLGCKRCPLVKSLGVNCFDNDSFYDKWENAETPRARKKYAKLFLGQIKQCK